MRLVHTHPSGLKPMHRLVCLRWKPADSGARRRSDAMASVLAAEGGWREIVNWRGCRLFLHEDPNDVAPLLLPREGGLVVGPLFRDSRVVGSADIDVATGAAWCADGGRALARDYWGGYLAVLADHGGDRVLVLRDPAGARPVHVSDPGDGGVAIVFTHLSDLASLRQLGAIDRDYLIMFLAHPRLVTERTGLSDVREILPGQCLSLERDGQATWMTWSPPTRRRAIAQESNDVIATRLRALIEKTMSAWASLERPMIHRLSGGLDSSVALHALKCAGADIRCVSERPRGVPEGDETAAAAAVAHAMGVAHTIIDYDAQEIDYTRLLEAPAAPKPSASLLTFADRHFMRVCAAPPNALITSGQGGDQVFYRANAIAAMASAVSDRLDLGSLINTALDIARVTRRSVWPVMAEGVEFGVLKSSRAYLKRMLSAAMRPGENGAQQAIAAAMSHPWCVEAGQRGAAEAAHALFLADLCYYHSPSILTQSLVVAPVLASQPIISFCCETPPYVMMRGGRDRALVRWAYRERLPAIAVARRRKGDTSRYFAAVAARNAAFAREVLCEGELKRLGLISEHGVSAEMAPDRARDGDGSSDGATSPAFIAEIWLRQVSALRRASPAHHPISSERSTSSGA